MIVLHAAWHRRRLHVWGEAAPEAAPKKAAKSKSGKGPSPYPHDAGAKRLVAAINEPVDAFRLTPSDASPVTVWAPAMLGKPIASSAAVAAPSASQKAPTLKAWSVGAAPLDPFDAVEWLCHCAEGASLGGGAFVGADIAYWVRVIRFAGSLVARQQYLPDVVREDGDYHARWRPALIGRDAERRARLADAMPDSCRALSESADAPPETSRRQILDEALASMTDALARFPYVAYPRPASKARTRTRTYDSLHDQWLAALKSEDSLMTGDTKALDAFAKETRAWRRPIDAVASSPFRLCFRVEEPPEDEPEEFDEEADALGLSIGTADSDLWRVQYLLQAADDQSLLVPLKSAWGGKSRAARLLREKDANVKEYGLLALGQASRIEPAVEASLKTARPDGFELETPEAFAFLSETAPALEQAGFGVLLPSWWTGKGTKQRLSMRGKVTSPKLTASGGLTLEKTVEFEWRAALGDAELSLEELQALAALKSPLVRVRGRWMQLSAEEIEAALAYMRKADGSMEARDALRLALGADAADAGVSVGAIDASGWFESLLEQLNTPSAIEDAPPPSGFSGTLRPYQGRGYSWMAFLREWGLGACLADDMGLGKTVQALALLERNREVNGGCPSLLVCPTSVVGNWQRETSRFAPELPVMVHHGTSRSKGAAFAKQAKKAGLVISSYGLLHRDLDTLKRVEWDSVILDEAQNVKNPGTKQSQAARSLPAAHRIALTGTPVENNIGDLWAIMEFLNPGFLGSQAAFKRTFFVPIQVQRDAEASDRLRRLTGPFVLRRLKTDKSIISDLPDKMEMKVYSNLTPEQASLYAAVLKEVENTLDEAEGMERRGLILATLGRLKQACNHPAHLLGDNSALPGRSGKLSRLTEMLEEAAQIGDASLIFTQYAEMGKLLKRHLQDAFGREALFLHGGLAKNKRDAMVERFQSPDGPELFILSLKAGGTGLNLTRANRVFHFDRWWNPAVEDQATDRAFRIGQSKDVHVHKFVCVGTMEEKIDEMIERKREIAEEVVGTGEGWITELSTQELKDLFALRADAIGAD